MKHSAPRSLELSEQAVSGLSLPRVSVTNKVHSRKRVAALFQPFSKKQETRNRGTRGVVWQEAAGSLA